MDFYEYDDDGLITASESLKQLLAGMTEDELIAVASSDKYNKSAKELALMRLLPPSVIHLTRGYGLFAIEMVLDRALPGIDGLKPAQRRILYAAHSLVKAKDYTKCQVILGEVGKYHPHATPYGVLTRLIDDYEGFTVPYLGAKGSFGKRFNEDAPASERYTSCKILPIVNEFFGEKNGMPMMLSVDDSSYEPELLTPSFPSVLVNPSMGIAVGVASRIPGFNFHDVVKATIELLKTGTVAEPLIPDFSTKGVYVKNKEQLKKLMNTGDGAIKLRGKWSVEGSSIIITEIPYYTTAESIIKDANEIKGVSDVKDLSGRESALKLEVVCSNKKVVASVLTELLRKTDLQLSLKMNMVVLINGAPKKVGVIELLEHWLDYRRKVLVKELNTNLESVKFDIERFEFLTEFLRDEEKREAFVETTVKQSISNARTLLGEWYPNVASDVLDWAARTNLSTWSGIASKESKLTELRRREVEILDGITNVDKIIIAKLEQLNSTYSYPRCTEISDDDYVLDNDTEIVAVAPEEVVVIINGKSIKKLKCNQLTMNEDGATVCMSNDVISFIDTQGRLLRVALENIPFGSIAKADLGIYLPSYIEKDDDFEVIAWEVIKPIKKGYVYKDGFVSVVDYSDWVDAQRCIRVTNNGVPTQSANIIAEYDLDAEYLLAVSTKGRLGIVKVSDLKVKDRTARTKMLDVKETDPICSVVPITNFELLSLFTDFGKFMNRMSRVPVTTGDLKDVELYTSVLNR